METAGREGEDENQGLMLTVRNLAVTINKNTIIDNLSFTLRKGEVLTIVGPNGAGKTVLLRTLLGLVEYTGTIEWLRRAKMGYVPQRLPFIRDIPMTVRDLFDLKMQEALQSDDMIRSMGITHDLLGRQVGLLSSGQFQRVLITWSLLGNPDVLLFDEPTTGIDLAGDETVYGLLEELHREKNLTMLLVTHDLSIVYRLSTTVLCLSRHMVCHGPPREVLSTESLRQLYGAEVKYYRHMHD